MVDSAFPAWHTLRMKLSEFYPLYMEIHVSVHNRKAVGHAKKLVIERELLPLLGDREMEKITLLDVKRLTAAWSKRPLTGKTINNYLTVLRNMLRVAAESELAGDICAVPALRKLPDAETRALTKAETSRLLRELAVEGKTWEFMARFALVTGLRIGELRSLRKSALRVDAGVRYAWVSESTSGRYSVVGLTKGKARPVPLSDVAVGFIKQFHDGGEYVFSLAELRKGPPVPLSYKRCLGAMSRARARAGLKWVNWHTLRHTFATNLRSRGAPLAQIQALLGHVDLRTTSRYAHAVTSELQTIVNLLEAP